MDTMDQMTHSTTASRNECPIESGGYHRQRARVAGAALLVGLACMSPTSGHGVQEGLRIVPDPDVQARIERVIQVALDKATTPADAFGAIVSLSPQAREGEPFFAQLFYFYWSHQRPGKSHLARREYALALIYYLKISKSTIAKVVVPYLDAEDPVLRKSARSFLRIVEGSPRTHERDYSYYLALVGSEKDHPPLGLVRYMYERSPGTAVLTLAGVYRGTSTNYRDVLWAEHVVSDVLWRQKHRFLDKDQVPPEALAELGKLSKHEAWWARLYAAEIIRQHPGFRTPEMIERLKQDQHELVRGAILAAERLEKVEIDGKYADPDIDKG